MRDRRALLILFLICLLPGCAASSDSPPLATTSLWGPILDLGKAEQPQAPALWVGSPGNVTAAWVGADAAGVHQDARAVIDGLLTDPITLPLPPDHPYDQQLLPGSDKALHLLWLDADASAGGELRLFSALLALGLVVQRGPLAVSDRQTLRYAATSTGDGLVTVVWSGGALAEPALYAARIDRRGLPGDSALLVRDADWPAMSRTNDGILHLFWLRPGDGTLYEGQIQDGALAQTRQIGPAFALDTGDQLNTLSAAVDSGTLYLFANITRSAGGDESWVVARPLNGDRWSAPRRIGVGDPRQPTIQTGLNTGRVNAAPPGEGWLRWAAPMPGQFDVLPVAGRLDDHLVVVYFQAGVVVGYQQIASIRTMIGPPILLPDRDRYLYLAWAEPLETGTSALRLTSSRG